MSMKAKGSNAERDLVRLFWENGWAAVRVAGSGSSRFPCPDVVAGNGQRILAVECKATSALKKYIETEGIAQLKEYSAKMGAEPWIGLRFSRHEWLFVSLDTLKEKSSSFMASLEDAKMLGLSFLELIEKQ